MHQYKHTSQRYSYTLWYRQACPQPEQPFLSNLPSCSEGDRQQVPEVIPATQLSYVLSGTTTNGSNGVTPYTAYEFQVLARNGAGDVMSAFSEPNTNTLSAGKWIIISYMYINNILVMEI